MRRGRFTEEQIIGVLREHEAGAKVMDLCRKHGIGALAGAREAAMGRSAVRLVELAGRASLGRDWEGKIKGVAATAA